MTKEQFKLIERYASELRQQFGLNETEAINLKSLLLKLNILTVFRPLSNDFSGMSLKSPGGNRFMLINSNQPRGRQHFTIAHELYHLYIDKDPKPHICATQRDKNESEQYADAFALMFLMPATGVLKLIPFEEMKIDAISLATIIRLEHYFSVSRQAIINRLRDLQNISRSKREQLLTYPPMRSAQEYGYDTALYKPGNENLVIGDFGEKARKLFDHEIISEGHYLELLSKIGINGCEN